MKFLSKYFSQIFLTLFCLILIAIWFKDGKLLATGEQGLMLINPDRFLELYKYSWNEIGTGGVSPGWNAMAPLLSIEAYIISIGIPVWLFQASLFFLLMLIGSLGTYYLSNELFKSVVEDKLKAKFGLIAALFYILNPISFLGIWYRGVADYSFIFFYALTPLFFYLFVSGINKSKKLFIIIVPFITLFFSFAFSSPAPPFLLWLLPFLYSLYLVWSNNLRVRFRQKMFPLIYFFLMFIFWTLINIWWIFPYIEFSKTTYFSEDGLVHAKNTLKANSGDFTLDNVVRLTHGGILYRNEDFGSIYKTPLFLLLSWLIPIVTIYGLLKLKRGQIKVFFVLTLILLLFLAKGTSPPFGGLFLWLFSHISVLQIFRNPLEKFGILLPIVYAPLFSFGLLYLLSKFQNLKIRKILLILAIIALAIINWPFFTGAIVSFGKRDIRVEVPPSFSEANKIISTGSHIILSIPVMGGSSGFYKWQYGYKGDDASEYLFNYPVVGTFFDANPFLSQLLIGISNGYLNQLVAATQFVSADVIVYRKDTDVAAFGYNLDALERSGKMIDGANLSKIFDSKEFSLWALPKEKVVPVIYTPQTVKFGDSPAELISLLENHQFDPKVEVYICTNKDKCKPNLQSDLSQIQIDTVPEKIEFIKISPVNYKIKVNNSRGKFLLVFNNNFHPGWDAFMEGRPIPADKHIVANGYANGFIIDRNGNFDISLQFILEEVVQKSYRVSLLAISLGAIILLGSTFKKLFTK